MTALAIIAVILWSAAVVAITWTAARRKPTPREVVNEEAQAIDRLVASQTQALQEIDADVARFDLAGYLNGKHPG